MATYTTNYNLKKPDSSDPFGDFRGDYNDNLDIIDANLGGGGGSSSLAGLSDVNLTTPTDGQVLTYDGNTSKWKNANPSGGGSKHTIVDENDQTMPSRTYLKFAGNVVVTDDSVNDETVVTVTGGGGGGSHTYSTSEQIVGTWLGDTLYEKSFVHTGNIADGAWVTIDNSYSPSNTGVMFVEHICFKLSGLTTLYASYSGQTLDVGIETTGKLYVENFTGETVTKVWFTIRYTKI